MIKKVVMVCVVVALVAALAGLTSGIQITSTSNPSTASAPKNLQFQSAAGPFVGSVKSDVYHYPSCYHVNAIKPENRITFNTVADACAHSYRPCKDCNPPPCGTTLTAAPTPVPTAAPTPAPTAAPTRVPTAATPQPQAHASSPAATPTPTSKASPTRAKASPSPVSKLVQTSNSTVDIGHASAAPSSQSSTPGFEAVYALGAFVAAFLAISAVRRR
jgi:Metal binding domain of Ada